MSESNTIFLLTDQNCWDFFGINNSKEIPQNLGRVARAGKLFNRSICLSVSLMQPEPEFLDAVLLPILIGSKVEQGRFLL